MKQVSSWWVAIALLAPVLVLFAALVPIGTGHTQTTSGPAGTIVIALTGAPPSPSAPYTPGFQSLSFNVQAVKLSPSTDPNIFQNQSDPNWTTIPVAPGVGLNNSGTIDVFTQLATLFNLNSNGPNPAGAGTGLSELQVDINQVQTVPILFNSFAVPANTYHAIELVLDGSNAGTAIPTCLENASSMLEGCIASQISLVDPSQYLTVSSNDGVSVPLNGLATLVINIMPVTSNTTPPVQMFAGRPGFSGGLYQFSPSITLAPTTANSLALVTGSAFGATKVAAELADTGQVVETTTIGGGSYQLLLPASVNGTAYDLVASGPFFSYAFAHNVLAQRNQTQTVPLNASTSGGQIALTGKVTDACSGMPLQGVTLEIVAPVAGSGADCTQVPTPSACVVLASANTDDTGTYPMPASNFVLQSFNTVPNGSYTMIVSDAGYDTVASSLSISGGAACSAGSGGVCNFALGRSANQRPGNHHATGAQSASAQCAGDGRRPRHASYRERGARHRAARLQYGTVHDFRTRAEQRSFTGFVRDGQRLLQRVAGEVERPHHRGTERYRDRLTLRDQRDAADSIDAMRGARIDHGLDRDLRRRHLDRTVQGWCAVDVDGSRPGERYRAGPVLDLCAGRSGTLRAATLRGQSAGCATHSGGHPDP